MMRKLSVAGVMSIILASSVVTETYSAPGGIMKKDFVEDIAQKKGKEKEEIDRKHKEQAIRQEKEVEVNSVNFIKFDEKIGEIFLPNPKVADITMIDNKSLYVSALAPGVTTLLIHDEEGNVLGDFLIRVTYPLKEIKRTIDKAYPDLDLSFISLEDKLIIQGKVPSPEIAADVAAIVGSFIGGDRVINRLSIATSTQVLLKVKVAEITRKLTKNLGISWRTLDTGNGLNSGIIGMSRGSASLPAYMADLTAAKTDLIKSDGGALSSVNGGRWFVAAGINNLAGLIEAIASEEFASLLAEPTLIALSGQPATFNSGGEVGYFVTQQNSNSKTTEFKSWGTKIEFTPVVLSENRINIKIKAEISSLSSKPSETTAPGTNKKDLETVVELGSGQSLALAGLLQTTKRSSGSETPGLAQLPLLGALFRNSLTELDENELVIIVTPYIVNPSSKQLKNPVEMAPVLMSPIDAIMQRKFHKNVCNVHSAGFTVK